MAEYKNWLPGNRVDVLGVGRGTLMKPSETGRRRAVDDMRYLMLCSQKRTRRLRGRGITNDRAKGIE
jgi:hypothetical protein